MPIGTLKRTLRRTFVAGLAVVLPLFLTFLILKVLVRSLDGVLAPVVEAIWGREIPLLGAVVTLLLILLVGALTTNIVGRKLVEMGDRLLLHIPIVRNVYAASKQFLDAFTLPSKKAFRQVVMVEFPRPGVYALGFLTGGDEGEFRDVLPEPMVKVFVPTAPNPTGGYVILVPQKEITLLTMSVEEGLKLIVSGGILVPPRVRRTEDAPLGG